MPQDKDFTVAAGKSAKQFMHALPQLLTQQVFAGTAAWREPLFGKSGLGGARQREQALCFPADTASQGRHVPAMQVNQSIEGDLTHPDSPKRPESDRDILRGIGRQLGIDMTAE